MNARATAILVAEDEPASLQLVETYLESKGYSVGVATDGNRALDMAATGDFDLLLLDVHMPLYDGKEVLQMLRKRLLAHPIKIIAVTADSRWALREEMTREGVDGYLIKPVSLAELGREVTRLLGASGRRRAVVPTQLARDFIGPRRDPIQTIAGGPLKRPVSQER